MQYGLPQPTRPGTCGLHVHVSPQGLWQTTLDAQDNAIARVLFFCGAPLGRSCCSFSRRTQRQLERWAARYGYRDRARWRCWSTLKKGSTAAATPASTCTNADTVEFRMFRGTLKLNTLIATLQLVDRICDAAIFMPDDELHDPVLEQLRQQPSRSRSWCSI